MNNRKYIGVPTQDEIIQQYNEILELTKGIVTYKQVKELVKSNPNIEVEVNYDSIYNYSKMPNGELKSDFITNIKDEDIEAIRYEYKNILVYCNIENGKSSYSNYITLYSDEGDQFGDEKYYDYEKEIERVAKMGLLKLNPNFN